MTNGYTTAGSDCIKQWVTVACASDVYKLLKESMSNAQFMTIWGHMKTKASVDIMSNVSYKLWDLITAIVSIVSTNSLVKV